MTRRIFSAKGIERFSEYQTVIKKRRILCPKCREVFETDTPRSSTSTNYAFCPHCKEFLNLKECEIK